jgi:hypothetical protein
MNSRFEPTRMIREGNGPPLVLLHCLGVDHHFWDSVLERSDVGLQMMTAFLKGEDRQMQLE